MSFNTRSIRASLVSSIFAVVLSVFAGSNSSAEVFPTGPVETVTPGAICNNPTELRYPEKIKYCARNVASETKREVILVYEKELGFQIYKLGRQKFKIDHYIPLCMGGANDEQNLWPQHESVYAVTDPLEFELCQKMAAGRLQQSKAIELIREAKRDLSKVQEIRNEVAGM